MTDAPAADSEPVVPPEDEPREWCLLAPVRCYGWPEGEPPAELAGGVKFGPLPHWPRPERERKDWSWWQRDRLRGLRVGFFLTYTAASLGDPHPSYPFPDPPSRQDHAVQILMLAAYATWIARPSRTSVQALVHVERLGGTWAIRSAHLSRIGPELHSRIPPTPPTLEDLRTARELHASLLKSRPAGSLWVAANSLSIALGRQPWVVRYLMTWVGLEALCGARKRTSWRLRTRVAALLASGEDDYFRRKKKIQAGYAWRSRIVHGATRDDLDPEKSLDLSLDAEEWLRLALRRIHLDADLRATVDGKHRNQVLDNLVRQYEDPNPPRDQQGCRGLHKLVRFLRLVKERAPQASRDAEGPGPETRRRPRP